MVMLHPLFKTGKTSFPMNTTPLGILSQGKKTGVFLGVNIR